MKGERQKKELRQRGFEFEVLDKKVLRDLNLIVSSL